MFRCVNSFLEKVEISVFLLMCGVGARYTCTRYARECAYVQVQQQGSMGWPVDLYIVARVASCARVCCACVMCVYVCACARVK